MASNEEVDPTADGAVKLFTPSVDLITGARQQLRLLWAVHLTRDNLLYKARGNLQCMLNTSALLS